MPLVQRPAERTRHFLGEKRFSGAGLALDEQRSRERQRRIDGEFQIVGGDVGIGAFEAHARVRVDGLQFPMLADAFGNRLCDP